MHGLREFHAELRASDYGYLRPGVSEDALGLRRRQRRSTSGLPLVRGYGREGIIEAVRGSPERVLPLESLPAGDHDHLHLCAGWEWLVLHGDRAIVADVRLRAMIMSSL